MSSLSENERNVARYYDEKFDEELVRLPDQFPVEFAMTLRYLSRYVPDGAELAEIGVGGAHYTEALARRGCRVHLVDISDRLLDTARRRLEAAGLADRIAGIHHCSATALTGLAGASLDAVLLMGPLYHLCEPEDRAKAVAESARVLKPGGVLIAAGINRLCYLRDQFRENPRDVVNRRDFTRRHLADGNLDPEHAPPIGYAHLTSAADFRALFAGRFEEVALLAVESFTGPWQSTLNGLTGAEREAWLDVIEQTAAWPESFGLGDHYLYVGSA